MVLSTILQPAYWPAFGQCSTPGEEFHVNPMKEVEPRNLWVIAAEARVGDFVTFRVHQYFTVFEVPKLADTW